MLILLSFSFYLKAVAEALDPSVTATPEQFLFPAQVFPGAEGQRRRVRLDGDPRQGHVEETHHRGLDSSRLADVRIFHVPVLVCTSLRP